MVDNSLIGRAIAAMLSLEIEERTENAVRHVFSYAITLTGVNL
jgi:hypothetical protein